MRPSEQRTVFAISGVDGAGKTTFGSRLEAELRAATPEATVNRLWLRWNPRASSARSASSSTVSSSHRGHPAKRAAKKLGLASVWVDAAIRSYRRQLALQLESSPAGSIVIADRFTLDFVADLVGAGLIGERRAPTVVAQLPQANRTIVLDASDETLVERCKPGDDPGLVIARARLYRRLAFVLGLEVVVSSDPGGSCDFWNALDLVPQS